MHFRHLGLAAQWHPIILRNRRGRDQAG